MPHCKGPDIKQFPGGSLSFQVAGEASRRRWQVLREKVNLERLQGRQAFELGTGNNRDPEGEG